MLQEIWAIKYDDNGETIQTYLCHASYTAGEYLKKDRVLEIDSPVFSDTVLDIPMPFLAKVLGEKGIEHLVAEYCKQVSKEIKADV